MDYISTRGSAPTLDFRAATLAGLASDGGLYVPAAWPQMSAQDIRALAGLDYAETAVRVMMPFVAGVLDEAELRELCRAAYGRFSHDAVTPLVQLDHRHWLLELFHGPTLAFKDVALQLLGQLFEKFLSGGDTDLTIVGATSGDTGSAAIEAVAGREHIRIFMLHPEGRVSDVQRDAEARSALTLSAVDSINWVRLMAQVVYYFYAAVRLGAPDRAIAFSVPTGNFGDVFAGYVAARMGLPVARLVVATNVNDILHRALSRGDYSAGSVTATATPSMDIQVSSNFERLLFDLAGRDGAAIDAMMAEFDRSRAMSIPEDMLAGARDLFSSARIDADGMTLALRWAQEHGGQIIDPHSAVGLAAARALDIDADVPVVTLATAHPAKFRDAVERATGVRPALPARLGNLFDREERYEKLPGDYDAVKAHILREAARG